MFEDMVYENIMDDMMKKTSNNVRTDEGSLLYNACAKQGMKLEEVYGDMEDISDNMLPDTQDLEHLIRYAAERGISYHYASAPVVRGVFLQKIEIGEQFLCGNYEYEVTDSLGGFVYELTCLTAGAEANNNMGELEPIEYIDEFEGGEITGIVQEGTPDEDVEVFRARVFASFQSTGFSGNKAAYREYIDEFTGVGGCKPKRREAGSSYIYITVISSQYERPDDDLVAHLQEAVDPEISHGEGDGYAPICHNVIIQAVTPITVDVRAEITWDTGYSTATSKGQIENVVDLYLLELRKKWEVSDYLTVRLAQVDARILTVEGVLDVKGTSINGRAENLILTPDEIPIRGNVNV